jgi:hypothetical protein
MITKTFQAPYSEAIRVPGAPLYLADINGPINAYTQQVLNPVAWQQVPAGGVGRGA